VTDHVNQDGVRQSDIMTTFGVLEQLRVNRTQAGQETEACIVNTVHCMVQEYEANADWNAPHPSDETDTDASQQRTADEHNGG